MRFDKYVVFQQLQSQLLRVFRVVVLCARFSSVGGHIIYPTIRRFFSTFQKNYIKCLQLKEEFVKYVLR